MTVRHIELEALQNCGTNRVTLEVFAECGKIRRMRDNHAKCVTGGNPTPHQTEGGKTPRIGQVAEMVD